MTGDFNVDGHIDLAVANLNGYTVSVLLGKGDGKFQPARTAVVGISGILATGDFNGDGRTDLAVAGASYNKVSGALTNEFWVFSSNGDGTFKRQATYAMVLNPYSIVTGDFNGDGRTDLAVLSTGGWPSIGSVSVLLGNGDGTFLPQVSYAVGNSPSWIVAGDFNGDGRTDLAVANTYDNTVGVLLGNGDGTLRVAGHHELRWSRPQLDHYGRLQRRRPHRPRRQRAADGVAGQGRRDVRATGQRCGAVSGPVVAGDFNGDGRTDLAVANAGTGTVSVLAGQWRRHLPAPGHLRRGVDPSAIVAGDFNGDGRTDLAVGTNSTPTTTVSVLLGNGDGTFQPQVTYAVGSWPQSIVAGDFNGDGRTRPRRRERRRDDNTISVLLGNGDGTFQPQVTYAVGSNPDAIVAGDFNGDGRTDLAVGGFGTQRQRDVGMSVLLGNGDGTFQPAEHLRAWVYSLTHRGG